MSRFDDLINLGRAGLIPLDAIRHIRRIVLKRRRNYRLKQLRPYQRRTK